ncbi:hypothetical protein GCM10018953_52240 [Streptosporangium nondiastaticum]
MVGPGARPAGAGTGHADGFQHGGELGAVVDVAGGEREGQGQAASVDGQVDLGGQSAARAPERLSALMDLG